MKNSIIKNIILWSILSISWIQWQTRFNNIKENTQEKIANNLSYDKDSIDIKKYWEDIKHFSKFLNWKNKNKLLTIQHSIFLDWLAQNRVIKNNNSSLDTSDVVNNRKSRHKILWTTAQRAFHWESKEIEQDNYCEYTLSNINSIQEAVNQLMKIPGFKEDISNPDFKEFWISYIDWGYFSIIFSKNNEAKDTLGQNKIDGE